MNVEKYIETKILFVFILALSFFISRVSEFIYSIFVLFVIFFLVPALVTYSFSNQIPGPLYSIVVLLVCLSTISVIKIKIPSVKSVTISYRLTLFLILLVLIPFIYSFGFYFDFKNILLEDVFKTRDFFDENTSTSINYLYNWLVKAILPVLFIYFLIHQKYAFASIALLILLYLYIISGNKIVYITAFVMVFFFFAGSDYLSKIKYFAIGLIVALLLIPVADFYVLDNHSLKGTFVMRMLFLPSHLNYYYFDFFEGIPLHYAESSFFKMFATYPYDKPVGFVISQAYFKTLSMNANNGIISDGFMNLGYMGVAINIILVCGIFLFFNSVNPDSRYLGVFFLMIFLFLSVPMLSMFVTSGLWIIILLALTIMRNQEAVLPDT